MNIGDFPASEEILCFMSIMKSNIYNVDPVKVQKYRFRNKDSSDII